MKYRCDVPMAEKKDVSKGCDKNCRECLCALAMDESGQWRHVNLDGGACANITKRNIRKQNEAEEARAKRRKARIQGGPIR